MKKVLAILAVIASLAMVGCASSSSTKSPWAAGAAPAPESAPVAAQPAPVAAETPAPVEADPFAVGEVSAPADDANAPTNPAEKPLLENYPAIRKANKEKVLAEIAAASSATPLPDPSTNRATILNVNKDTAVIEFKTIRSKEDGGPFKVGQRVIIGKDDYRTLFQILLVETENRYIAEEVRGVLYTDEMKELFNLVPADDVACVEWVDPEDPEAVKAAAAKARANSTDAEAAVDDDEEEDDDSEEEDISFDDDDE